MFIVVHDIHCSICMSYVIYGVYIYDIYYILYTYGSYYGHMAHDHSIQKYSMTVYGIYYYVNIYEDPTHSPASVLLATLKVSGNLRYIIPRRGNKFGPLMLSCSI